MCSAVTVNRTVAILAKPNRTKTMFLNMKFRLFLSKYSHFMHSFTRLLATFSSVAPIMHLTVIGG